MKLLNTIFLLLIPFILFADNLSSTNTNKNLLELRSPGNRLQLNVELDHKTETISYSVKILQPVAREILQQSKLGLIIDGDNYNSQLALQSKPDITTHDESYTLVSGKHKHVHDVFNQCDLTLKTQTGYLFYLRFRVSDNGVAFRYGINEKNRRKNCFLFSEETTFDLPDTGKMWGQPYDKISKYTPAYEAYYKNGIEIGTSAPNDKNGWALPLLFHVGDDWALITESDIDENNAAIHLEPKCEPGIYKVSLPEEDEAFNICSSAPELTLPWLSPWRVIIIGDSLADIFESNLVTSLSRKATTESTNWIKPGRASWSWWSASESPKDFNVLKKYVDFSAEMGWEYSLVDANWNNMKNGDLEKLTKYANSKKVGLLVWYNSGGQHNIVEEEPRNCIHDPVKRKQTFAWLQKIGVKGVKVDFFHSDKQCIIKQYIDILKDAAQYELVVNFHGCTIPRGWRRSYPNLLSMEAVTGAECYKYDKDYPAAAPMLNTIYPFTRNVTGPMDYTPVTFSHHRLPHFTTFGHELALSVVFESGIIHMADAVESYLALPEYVQSFLKKLPANWDESRLLGGFPGKAAYIARRSGNEWYIAGINGEFKEKTFSISFDFLENDKYDLTLIMDGMNNKMFNHENTKIKKNNKRELKLLPYGGFVAICKPTNF